VFERFTDRARRVVVLAQEEARMLNHNYIGTEHILLGLIHEAEGVAAQALESLGISLEAVRYEVEAIIGEGQTAPTGHIPFTPRAKKVLEMSLREALQLGHNYIGTEHILLGLIREGEGVAAQVLQKLGADLNRVRQQVIQLLSGYTGGKVEALELSEEEIGVLADIAEGATRKQIAEKLGLSRDELRSRIDKALEKLRTRSAGTRVEQTHEAPRCPKCRGELAETGAFVTLDLPVQGTEEKRAVGFAFCRRCGTWLGAA
jgi:ATP/maltotriose-dependent transcriptional regulator MalT